jgi:hypothetical protein
VSEPTSSPPGRRQRHTSASSRSCSVKSALTRSCCSPVLVQEATEPVASTNAALLILTDDGQPGGWFWCLQPERSVWTVFVVVLDVHPKDPRQMPASYNQEPVQALGADGAHPPLRVGVRPGRPDGRHEHLGTLRAEHVVEAPGELRVPVTEQESYPSASLFQDEQQVAGLLGDPGAVRVAGHTGQMDPAWCRVR